MADYKSNTFYIFVQIHALLDKKHETDLALFLQKPEHIALLSDLARACRLIKTEYVSHSNELEYLLRLRNLICVFDKVNAEYENLFIEASHRYDLQAQKEWMSRDAIAKFLKGKHKCINVETSEEYLAATNVLSKISQSQTHKVLHDVFNVIFGLLAECGELIHEKDPSTSDIKNALIESYNRFAREMYSIYLREMKREAQAYKVCRSRTLDSIAWEGMLKNEEDVLRLAVDGKLMEAVEENQKFKPFELLAEPMQMYYGLLQKILNVCNDEMLFDFEYAFEQHNNITLALETGNIDLFNQLVLRQDIIRTEMLPPLKEVFLRRVGLVNNNKIAIPEGSVAAINSLLSSGETAEFIPECVIGIINADLPDPEKQEVFKKIQGLKIASKNAVQQTINELIDAGKLAVEYSTNDQIYDAIGAYLKISKKTFSNVQLNKKKYLNAN